MKLKPGDLFYSTQQGLVKMVTETKGRQIHYLDETESDFYYNYVKPIDPSKCTDIQEVWGADVVTDELITALLVHGPYEQCCINGEVIRPYKLRKYPIPPEKKPMHKVMKCIGHFVDWCITGVLVLFWPLIFVLTWTSGWFDPLARTFYDWSGDPAKFDDDDFAICVFITFWPNLVIVILGVLLYTFPVWICSALVVIAVLWGLGKCWKVYMESTDEIR